MLTNHAVGKVLSAGVIGILYEVKPGSQEIRSFSSVTTKSYSNKDLTKESSQYTDVHFDIY